MKGFARYRHDLGLYREGLDFPSFGHSDTTFSSGETARYTKRTNLVQLDTSNYRADVGLWEGSAGC